MALVAALTDVSNEIFCIFRNALQPVLEMVQFYIRGKQHLCLLFKVLSLKKDAFEWYLVNQFARLALALYSCKGVLSNFHRNYHHSHNHKQSSSLILLDHPQS